MQTVSGPTSIVLFVQNARADRLELRTTARRFPPRRYVLHT